VILRGLLALLGSQSLLADFWGAIADFFLSFITPKREKGATLD